MHADINGNYVSFYICLLNPVKYTKMFRRSFLHIKINVFTELFTLNSILRSNKN